MELRVGPGAVDVTCEGRLAGRYVFDDPYKPYLHPLNTPAGRTVSLRSPHDHKHHKGLMYALRTRDLNWWEERETLPGERVGRQRHDGFSSVVEEGDTVGFAEELTWLAFAGGTETFRERRALSCRALPERRAYEWTWTTELEALRDVELVMSQWSFPDARGVPVNYHGLGVRLRRDWGCTGGNRLLLDRAPVSFCEGMGATPTEAVFEGSLDGTWPVERAWVGIRQGQGHALFVIEQPFAYFGFGPTNRAPLALERGARLVERYVVTVADGGS